jgi:hypothetical protein
MARAKQVSKRKRRKMALAALGRRDVFSDGRRRISNIADSECAVARRRTASRNYSR